MQCGKSSSQFNFTTNSEKKSCDYFLSQIINEKKGLKRALEEQIIQNAKFSKTKQTDNSEMKQQNRPEDEAFQNSVAKTKLFHMLTKEKNHIDSLTPGNSSQNCSTKTHKNEALITQEHLKDFIKLAEDSISSSCGRFGTDSVQKSIASSCTDINNNIVNINDNNNYVSDMATDIEEIGTNSKTDPNIQKGDLFMQVNLFVHNMLKKAMLASKI